MYLLLSEAGPPPHMKNDQVRDLHSVSPELCSDLLPQAYQELISIYFHRWELSPVVLAQGLSVPSVPHSLPPTHLQLATWYSSARQDSHSTKHFLLGWEAWPRKPDSSCVQKKHSAHPFQLLVLSHLETEVRAT